jgi:hypothetical protein
MKKNIRWNKSVLYFNQKAVGLDQIWENILYKFKQHCSFSQTVRIFGNRYCLDILLQSLDGRDVIHFKIASLDRS